MTDLRKDCELVEVVYQNDNKKAVMTFLDVENGQVLEVNFNKQVYDDGKFVDDKEKEERVKEWCKEYFDTTFDKLGSVTGVKKDVYVYEKFNSLWETKETVKFTKEHVGKFFETKISRVVNDGKGIRIFFEHEDKEYESKMMYADYIQNLGQWFENPQKKSAQYAKFKDKFGVEVDKADEIVDKDIMVEVKIAFNKFPYADIKKPNWSK